MGTKKEHNTLEREEFLERRRIYMREYRAKQSEKRKKIREKEKRKKQREKERLNEKLRLKKEKEKERKRKIKEKKKRPVGRPKKIGRKKKWKRKKEHKPRIYKKLPPFTYRIVSCVNQKQKKIIGDYRYKSDAYNVFSNLKNTSTGVIFPSTFYSGGDVPKNMVNEYVLLTTNEIDKPVYYRDEYGKIREVKTDSKKWKIIDKFKYEVEETFWVFGYDKVSDRKNFMWIYDNIIMDGVNISYEYKRVMIYMNKLLVKEDNGNIDIIICKCEEDSVRMYNMMFEMVRKEKVKQILFIGDFSEISEKRRRLEKELVDITGWPLKKIRMRNQTYYKRV